MSAKPKSEYETDFYAWAMHTAKLIREHKLSEIDFENVAEEIESMGRSEKHELFSRLIVLICHLLKWQFQPGKQGSSWKETIVEQRSAIEILLEDNPSLRPQLDGQLIRAYQYGRKKAISETGMPNNIFPVACPYILSQVLDYDFLPQSES